MDLKPNDDTTETSDDDEILLGENTRTDSVPEVTVLLAGSSLLSTPDVRHSGKIMYEFAALKRQKIMYEFAALKRHKLL